ncbi:hypothetical protein [Paraburkholderia silvatlantica]|uniref:Uncharacterized protein n=1 Tax=Paraburkholderia silvatlantica TaxID=321895 RepID=A0ABR6FH61_9BURK|nr:hypothetical protein [Paraburkholderia silvatlantica]MBB2926761.1 hypothetical protein [Paraburkholderia silvatlantica]PVY37611.1 hypothetical protein C7411_101226 [Paraburkholderia silvatlantica]PXW42573.1 hypothetical protein C7413_101226 [Paraburkholderia silvatlantica]
MNEERRAKIEAVAGRFIQEVMTTGLTWDEAVAVFGLAAKATAQTAVRLGAGTPADCLTVARIRFEDAFAQDVRVVVTESAAQARHVAHSDNPLLATAHRRHTAKLH